MHFTIFFLSLELDGNNLFGDPEFLKFRSHGPDFQRKRIIGSILLMLLVNGGCCCERKSEAISATRFGEISPLCQNVKSLFKFFKGFIVFDKMSNYFGNLIFHQANHCCRWPNIYPFVHTELDVIK